MRISDWSSDVCSSDLNALRRLGSGWAVFVEAQRVPALDYPESTFPDPVSALVDMERGEQFREAGSHFESGNYLTDRKSDVQGERVSVCVELRGSGISKKKKKIRNMQERIEITQ